MLRQMNSPDGKRLLALVRGGDYAHAGEEEAIELTFRNVEKRYEQSILDVGCGRGGSANHLWQNGWGTVAGIDRDGDSIAYARTRYPELRFDACDVLEVPRALARNFDVIYMLNAFYAFEAQRDALAALRKVAVHGARMLIFEYLDRGGFAMNPLIVNGAAIVPHAIDMAHTPEDLKQTGWRLRSADQLNDDYQRWYSDLVNRIENKRGEIVAQGGDDALTYMREVYGGMLKKIESGLLGGILLDIVAC